MTICSDSLRWLGEVSVDSGEFAIIDTAYLDIISGHCRSLEELQESVDRWHGQVIHWGDGDYPVYELLDDEGEVKGLVILQEDE